MCFDTVCFDERKSTWLVNNALQRFLFGKPFGIRGLSAVTMESRLTKTETSVVVSV